MTAESRAIAKPRRRKAAEAREQQLFVEARKARLAGDAPRRTFILKNRGLPEERRSKRAGQLSLCKVSIDRTFVSDIELDNGTGNWSGCDYFGDVQFADWPERELLGTGGRDLSRRRK